jgi:hypothetical protein
MLVVALDPGLTGACAVLDHNGLRAVFDLPVMDIPDIGPKTKVRKKIDARGMVRALRQHCPVGESVHAVIEAVGVMGPDAKNAVQFQGSLMRTFGALEAVIECLGWKVEYANTRTWKRCFGLIDSNLSPAQRKAKAMERARLLYPACREIARAKDHNRAEAILIGHWYRSENA